jgi:hypothetical protein
MFSIKSTNNSSKIQLGLRHQFPRLSMKVQLKLIKHGLSLIDIERKFKDLMSENILMSKIMKEEKKECNKKLRKDGITTTLSSMEVSLRKKPDTMIISKLIMKLKMKMNKLNKN